MLAAIDSSALPVLCQIYLILLVLFLFAVHHFLVIGLVLSYSVLPVFEEAIHFLAVFELEFLQLRYASFYCNAGFLTVLTGISDFNLFIAILNFELGILRIHIVPGFGFGLHVGFELLSISQLTYMILSRCGQCSLLRGWLSTFLTERVSSMSVSLI